MAIPKGTKVRQIVPVIEGSVIDYSIDRETGETQLLVEWADADGNTASKYFKEGELEIVPE